MGEFDRELMNCCSSDCRFNSDEDAQKLAGQVRECDFTAHQLVQRVRDVAQAFGRHCRVGQCAMQLLGSLDYLCLEIDYLGEYLVSDLAELNVPGQFEKGQADAASLFKGFGREVFAK